MDAEIARIYGERLRVRACGLLYVDEALLMVNHQKITSHSFWSVPGGGVEFKETISQCLVREVQEECGLMVTAGSFAFGCEFIKDPLHSIELFFWIYQIGGMLRQGNDPELPIITQTKFMNAEEIAALPPHECHGIFNRAKSKNEFEQLAGFYRI